MLTTKEINYFHNETLCRGFLAYDNEWTNSHPAVMVAHDWRGRGEEACAKASEIVKLGYIGFAIDMYGEAKQGHDSLQCKALMTPLVQNRKKLRERIQQAFSLLASMSQVDSLNIAALGYCFGGLCVLDLARSGVNIKGVISFHGVLTAPSDLDYQPLNTQMLILHGFDDPLVPPEQIDEFAKEMTQRQVDWQIHQFGLTAHSFTNPAANGNTKGHQYNVQADHRSWQSTKQFLSHLLMKSFD